LRDPCNFKIIEPADEPALDSLFEEFFHPALPIIILLILQFQ
jgi:hypothetical protein